MKKQDDTLKKRLESFIMAMLFAMLIIIFVCDLRMFRRNNGVPESNFLELQTLNLDQGISGANEPTTPRTGLPY